MRIFYQKFYYFDEKPTFILHQKSIRPFDLLRLENIYPNSEIVLYRNTIF